MPKQWFASQSVETGISQAYHGNKGILSQVSEHFYTFLTMSLDRGFWRGLDQVFTTLN